MNSERQVRSVLKKYSLELKQLGVSDPKDSTELILCHVLKLDKTTLRRDYNRLLADDEFSDFIKMIKRRENHEPVWQIIGMVNFWGLDFYVDQNVLVPRPETELLVEKALEGISNFEFRFSNESSNIELKKSNLNQNSKFKTTNLRILDVGSGSGAIIIALASEITKQNHQNINYSFFASDISEKALQILRKNVGLHNLERLIKVKHGNLFGPWKGQKFNIITANLPYVPHEDMSTLALDLLHYEPRVALDGGKNGLCIYEKFLKELKGYLCDDGKVFCEIGDKQGDLFKQLVDKYIPNCTCQILKDFAGFDRVAIIKLNK